MMSVFLIAGFLFMIVLFMVAAIQTAGQCSRIEEEEERRRWEQMQHRGSESK